MKRLVLFLFLVPSYFLSAQSLQLSELGLAAPKVNCTSVKDQYMSSTCWSFSSVSFLESEIIKNGKGKLDLSEMFIARYSMMRKIERHLALKGSNYFTPGGQFHDVMWVIKNYGIVPESVYSGKGQNEMNHNHAEMDTVLSQFVRDCIQYGIYSVSDEQRAQLDSLFDFYYGVVPKKFVYNGKEYTPKAFATDYLQLNADDYAEITSYTHHPFYRSFVLEDKYNWTGDAYYNVPLNEFSSITDHALQNGYTVGWDGDARDDGFHYYDGLAYLPDGIKSDQLSRQTAFMDQSTLLDHMMHITGVTKDKFGKKWYYIKNSWGDYSNLLHGFIFMREDYFKIRTVAIIVNKKAVPVEISKKLKW